MKVRLLRQNRIDGKAGDIVEVSPARAAFLFEVNLAEPVTIREQIGTPEKAKRAARTEKADAEPEKKTTRRKK